MTKDEMKMTFTQTITREEMKNRISMALKDPILQQGFEIICKNLAELETENNKLLDVINNQDVKIADLEKQIEKMKCCGNCKYSNQESVYSIVCKVGGIDKSDYINVDDNQVCDKWEIK